MKALVASLGSVDIDEAMATAVAAPVASAAPAASSGGEPLRLLPLRKRRLRSPRKRRAASKVLAPCSAEATIGTN